MATKNYTFPSDSSGGNDYQPDLTDTADIAVAFSDFVEGIQSVFNSVGSDVSAIDNKLDGTTDLSVPASKFILQGSQSANNIKFAVTNTGSITLSLPSATTTIVGTDSSQTLTNKTLSAATISGTTTLTGTVNASGTTINSPTIASPTISNPTITGSVTGDQDFNANVNIDGTLNAGSTNVSALTVNGVVIQSGYIPITGMIVMYNGSTAPTGWAVCDGLNGTPDLRDKFIVGANPSKLLNTSGGSTTTSNHDGHSHTLSGTAAAGTTDSGGADHSHSIAHDHGCSDAGSHDHNGSVGGPTSSGTAATGNTRAYATSGHAHNFNTNSGGTHAHNIVASNAGSGNSNAWSHSHGQNAVSISGSAVSAGAHSHTITPPYYALTYIIKL
jgi:hypothetical protein